MFDLVRSIVKNIVDHHNIKLSEHKLEITMAQELRPGGVAYMLDGEPNTRLLSKAYPATETETVILEKIEYLLVKLHKGIGVTRIGLKDGVENRTIFITDDAEKYMLMTVPPDMEMRTSEAPNMFKSAALAIELKYLEELDERDRDRFMAKCTKYINERVMPYLIENHETELLSNNIRITVSCTSGLVIAKHIHNGRKYFHGELF